jgi:hypothetical protein
MVGGMTTMGKAVVWMKRVLDVSLVLLIVGALSFAVVFIEGAWGMGEGTLMVQVPAHFAPGADVAIENEVLGTGQVGDASGKATFLADVSSATALLYLLGLVLSLAPAFVLVIILRRIARSVVAGEPFTDANIDRIRAIGLLVMALEFLRGAVQLGLETMVMATSEMPGYTLVAWGEWNFGVVILGAVILGLAEVFRYGMQLQADVDLTV